MVFLSQYALPAGYVSALLLFLLGLLVGSFLNVVVYRLPVMLQQEWELAAREQLGLAVDTPQLKFNLCTPASRCGSCGVKIRCWQNIPVFSWLFLRGRCAHCHVRISIRYPLVELLTALLFGVVGWQYGLTVEGIFACIFVAFVIAMIFIDADTQLLPDQLTLPLIWLGLLFNLLSGFIHLDSAVIGAMVGYLSLWSLYYLFKLLTGKEGMGRGDFKMLSAIGAWFGAGVLPIVAFVAALIGIVFATIKQIGRGKPIAFGPCLGIAALLVLLFYEKFRLLIDWWLHKSGFAV